jgi:hypothetical protein
VTRCFVAWSKWRYVLTTGRRSRSMWRLWPPSSGIFAGESRSQGSGGECPEPPSDQGSGLTVRRYPQIPSTPTFDRSARSPAGSPTRASSLLTPSGGHAVGPRAARSCRPRRRLPRAPRLATSGRSSAAAPGEGHSTCATRPSSRSS